MLLFYYFYFCLHLWGLLRSEPDMLAASMRVVAHKVVNETWFINSILEEFMLHVGHVPWLHVGTFAMLQRYHGEDWGLFFFTIEILLHQVLSQWALLSLHEWCWVLILGLSQLWCSNQCFLTWILSQFPNLRFPATFRCFIPTTPDTLSWSHICITFLDILNPFLNGINLILNLCHLHVHLTLVDHHTFQLGNLA